MHELTENLHDAVEGRAIAPVQAQRRRASLFQIYVLMASAAFIALAVAAHFVPYFPIDLTITREVQSYHGAVFDAVMRALGWVGITLLAQLLSVSLLVSLLLGALRC